MRRPQLYTGLTATLCSLKIRYFESYTTIFTPIMLSANQYLFKSICSIYRRFVLIVTRLQIYKKIKIDTEKWIFFEKNCRDVVHNVSASMIVHNVSASMIVCNVSASMDCTQLLWRRCAQRLYVIRIFLILLISNEKCNIFGFY